VPRLGRSRPFPPHLTPLGPALSGPSAVQGTGVLVPAGTRNSAGTGQLAGTGKLAAAGTKAATGFSAIGGTGTATVTPGAVPAVVFTFGTPYSQGFSHLSTQYYLLPVNATRSGTAYNPSGDAVAFAFMPTPTQVPGSGDWVPGSWDANPSSILYPYNAKVLIGTPASVTLGIGRYVVYVRITDSPQIPVDIAGYLNIS
jgi:hypothetical protein